MRETRPSGSEGGARFNSSSLPLSKPAEEGWRIVKSLRVLAAVLCRFGFD